MNDSRKRMVSVRISPSDLSRVKDVSKRLMIRESDLIRFSVKKMLDQLSPLHDENVKGVNLLPPLLELGNDLSRYFDFDVESLDTIINSGVEEGETVVDRDDLLLMSMCGSENDYAMIKLREIFRTSIDTANLHLLLKEHIIQKYLQSAEVPRHKMDQDDRAMIKDEETVVSEEPVADIVG